MGCGDPEAEITMLRVECPWRELSMSPESSAVTDYKDRLRNSARFHGVCVYTRALEALRQRQGIDERMAELQRSVNVLLEVCEEDSVPLPSDLLLPFSEEMPLSISLIDAIRHLLMRRSDGMTAAEVRDGLIAMELDLHKLWNPIVLIRSTLKRLMERGEIAGLPENKPVRYKWINPVGMANGRSPAHRTSGRHRKEPEPRPA